MKKYCNHQQHPPSLLRCTLLALYLEEGVSQHHDAQVVFLLLFRTSSGSGSALYAHEINKHNTMPAATYIGHLAPSVTSDWTKNEMTACKSHSGRPLSVAGTYIDYVVRVFFAR